MHEMGITESILENIFSHAEEHGAKRVNKVILEFGEMTQVVPDSILFYFELLGKDTIIEGAEVDIKMIPARAKCTNCGEEFEVRDLIFVCPKCSGFATDIISGREMNIKSIEVEE